MANKPKSERPTDESIARINQVIKVATEQKNEEIAKLQEKLSMSPWIFEMVGKIKSMIFTEEQAKCLKFLFLKKAKESKDYREVYGMTWEEFCKHAGFSWRTADRWLTELEPLTTEFSAKLADFSGYDLNKIKYLCKAKSANLAEIKDNAIVYEGEEIPLTPEHKDQIQAILEKIEETYKKNEASLKKEIEDKEGDLRAKDRVLKDKEDNNQSLHRQLDKLTRLAKEKGLTPEEDAFLAKMETLRIMLDGSYLVHLERAGVRELLRDEDGNLAIPRMRAAYIATLRYFQLQINKLYDDAIANYGDPGMLPEKAWHPGMTLQ